jgi:hypothetical protein
VPITIYNFVCVHERDARASGAKVIQNLLRLVNDCGYFSDPNNDCVKLRDQVYNSERFAFLNFSYSI